MRREPAWRVFAEEYFASKVVESSEEEKSPTYVITPLGARINRVFIVGTLVETMNYGSEEEPLIRSVIADPTGHFYLNTGQYNQDAGFSLMKLEAPSYVAVVGKVHVYEPEPGIIKKYIRPEIVKEVDESTRNRWIVETAKDTKERIDAMRDALALEEPTKESLLSMDIPPRLASGIERAVKEYGEIDLSRYWELVGDALRFVISERSLPVKEESGEDDRENVMQLINSVAQGDDVLWDDLRKAAQDAGMSEETLENEVDRMVREGILYERKIGEILRIDRDTD